jgi:hypothetical protein
LDGAEIFGAEPVRDFGIAALDPCQLYGCDKCVGVLIGRFSREIYLNQMGDGGVRSLADVSLMVQFIPEFVPRLRAISVRLQHGEKMARIEGSSVSTPKLQPTIVS